MAYPPGGSGSSSSDSINGALGPVSNGAFAQAAPSNPTRRPSMASAPFSLRHLAFEVKSDVPDGVISTAKPKPAFPNPETYLRRNSLGQAPRPGAEPFQWPAEMKAPIEGALAIPSLPFRRSSVGSSPDPRYAPIEQLLEMFPPASPITAGVPKLTGRPKQRPLPLEYKNIAETYDRNLHLLKAIKANLLLELKKYAAEQLNKANVVLQTKKQAVARNLIKQLELDVPYEIFSTERPPQTAFTPLLSQIYTFETKKLAAEKIAEDTNAAATRARREALSQQTEFLLTPKPEEVRAHLSSKGEIEEIEKKAVRAKQLAKAADKLAAAQKKCLAALSEFKIAENNLAIESENISKIFFKSENKNIQSSYRDHITPYEKAFNVAKAEYMYAAEQLRLALAQKEKLSGLSEEKQEEVNFASTEERRRFSHPYLYGNLAACVIRLQSFISQAIAQNNKHEADHGKYSWNHGTLYRILKYYQRRVSENFNIGEVDDKHKAFFLHELQASLQDASLNIKNQLQKEWATAGYFTYNGRDLHELVCEAEYLNPALARGQFKVDYIDAVFEQKNPIQLDKRLRNYVKARLIQQGYPSLVYVFQKYLDEAFETLSGDIDSGAVHSLKERKLDLIPLNTHEIVCIVYTKFWNKKQEWNNYQENYCVDIAIQFTISVTPDKQKDSAWNSHMETLSQCEHDFKVCAFYYSDLQREQKLQTALPTELQQIQQKISGTHAKLLACQAQLQQKRVELQRATLLTRPTIEQSIKQMEIDEKTFIYNIKTSQQQEQLLRKTPLIIENAIKKMFDAAHCK